MGSEPDSYHLCPSELFGAAIYGTRECAMEECLIHEARDDEANGCHKIIYTLFG